MNTQNTIEKIFLKKKDKNLPDPGANSQDILNLLQTLYFDVGLNHSVKGVFQGSAGALSVYIARRSLIMPWRACAAALQHCNTPFTEWFSPTTK